MKKLVGVLVSILLPLNLWAAEVLRYVNTASAGGDGTTNNIAGATAAYASLSAWEAAENTDLVAAGNYMKVIVSGVAADTTDFIIDGWTTGEDNYILITTDSSIANSVHGGTWNANAYRFESASAGAIGITVSEDYVRFNGLQIQKTSSSATLRSGIRVTSVGVGEIQVMNCLFKGVVGAAKKATGLRLTDADPVFVVNNNVFYDFTESGSFGIDMTGVNPEAHIYGNTFYGNDVGLEANTGTRLRNNLFEDNVTDDVTETGAVHADSSYNASDFASVPGSNGINGEAALVNEGADNFHLSPADTVANNAGPSLSCAVYWKAGNRDYEATARTSNCVGTWDIGADETAFRSCR